MKRFLALGLTALAVVACDEASSKDPATATRDALNPPSGLVSVTWDKKIELRWQAMNAEEDFKGFRVFAVAKPISALPAPTYPAGYTLDKLRTGAVPRCDQNSALFVEFGFPAIEEGDKECEGDEASDSGPAAGDAKELTLSGKGMLAAEEGDGTDTAADEEAEESLPPQVVKCQNEAGTVVSTEQLSLPAPVPALTEQVCIVTALADGTALANGTTYTFFVAAIMADDTFEKVEVSWTSNFVEDTPSTQIFSGTVELDVGKMQYLPLESIITKAAFDTLEDAACDTNNTGCFVYKLNKLSAKGIYFGRRGDGDYPQRTFISATAGEDLALLLRGPQTQDPRDTEGTIATSIPGDQAADSAVAGTYDTTGLPQPVYGNQVFDFTVMISGAKHYGKVVVKEVSLADPADETSVVSYPITVLLQTAPTIRHYFK
jgi:hypothetical protein